MTDTKRGSVLSDPARLAALRATELLNAAPDKAFERLVRLAANVLRAPVAFVSLVEEDRQFFQVGVGLPEPWASRRETPLSHSFCQHVVDRAEPLVVRDAREHPLVRDNLAILDLGVIAYAGIPLRSHDGHVLGSFAVVDRGPREWTPAEIEVLMDLAASAMTEIHLRRTTREAEERAAEMAEQAAALQGFASALRESEETYRRLVELSPDAILIHRRGTIVFANPAAQRLLGAERAEELLGRPSLDIVHPERRHAAQERMTRIEAGETVRLAETVFVRLDGRPVDVEATGAPAIYRGQPAMQVVVRDITERKRADRERRQYLAEAEAARAEAVAANQAKSEFLATMSHELRTPLNAIMAYTDILQMGIAGAINEGQRAQLDRIRVSSQHLLGLINDVLDLAKVEAGRMEVQRQRSPVRNAVAAALTLVQPQASSKRLELHDRCTADDATHYVGDEDRVTQILANLLSNAVKFTQEGSITLTCGTVPTGEPGVRLPGGGPWTFVRVTDTGTGIDPDEIERIFQPFVQADRGLTRGAGGTGLGLTISRKMAQLMGGDLVVSSELGRGSTFTLWLPADAGDVPQVGPIVPAADRVALPARRLEPVGKALQARARAILDRFIQRVRQDGSVPGAAQLGAADAENHFLAFLADLGQALVILETSQTIPERLLQDGSRIQTVVAELHGTQRAQLGWTEEELRREFQILRDEVEMALRARGLETEEADLEEALELLRRLLDRAEQVSVGSLRRANQLRSS